MSDHPKATIRPFDPARDDAEGILAIDRVTFRDCPYDVAQVRGLLAGGPMQAWVAEVGLRVAGFVVAFPTRAAQGPGWEIDLVAVHPQHRGQGLATALIGAASARPPAGTLYLRAVVATANAASARAFRRSGFAPAPSPCRLLLYVVRGRQPRAPGAPGSGRPVAVRVEAPAGQDSLVLVAGPEAQPRGQAELLPVQTLLYRGGWIEALSSRTAAARAALIEAAVERAKQDGWDEVGCLAPARPAPGQDGGWPLRRALLAAGFHDEGEYRIFTRWPEARP
jgi:ribosomal protein S18 acetylase RimI-like enzyme